MVLRGISTGMSAVDALLNTLEFSSMFLSFLGARVFLHVFTSPHPNAALRMVLRRTVASPITQSWVLVIP